MRVRRMRGGGVFFFSPFFFLVRGRGARLMVQLVMGMLQSDELVSHTHVVTKRCSNGLLRAAGTGWQWGPSLQTQSRGCWDRPGLSRALLAARFLKRAPKIPRRPKRGNMRHKGLRTRQA